MPNLGHSHSLCTTRVPCQHPPHPTCHQATRLHRAPTPFRATASTATRESHQHIPWDRSHRYDTTMLQLCPLHTFMGKTTNKYLVIKNKSVPSVIWKVLTLFLSISNPQGPCTGSHVRSPPLRGPRSAPVSDVAATPSTGPWLSAPAPPARTSARSTPTLFHRTSTRYETVQSSFRFCLWSEIVAFIDFCCLFTFHSNAGTDTPCFLPPPWKLNTTGTPFPLLPPLTPNCSQDWAPTSPMLAGSEPQTERDSQKQTDRKRTESHSTLCFSWVVGHRYRSRCQPQTGGPLLLPVLLFNFVPFQRQETPCWASEWKGWMKNSWQFLF